MAHHVKLQQGAQHVLALEPCASAFALSGYGSWPRVLQWLVKFAWPHNMLGSCSAAECAHLLQSSLLYGKKIPASQQSTEKLAAAGLASVRITDTALPTKQLGLAGLATMR